MKILTRDWIIFFSIVVLTSGCISKETWPIPVKPKMLPVEIVSVADVKIEDSGYYLDVEDAVNLANNVDELKAYTKKLEILIKKMAKCYGAKLEE